MTKSDEKLEAELRSLRPIDVPDELAERISTQLGDTCSAPRRRPWPRIILAGSLSAAAACVIVAIALWSGDHRLAGVSQVPHPTVVESDKQQIPPPTLRAYNLALRQSEEALEELLNRHAAMLPHDVAGSNGHSLAELRRRYRNH